MSIEDGTKRRKPYMRIKEYVCPLCGLDYDDDHTCYVKCEGNCGFVIENKRRFRRYRGEPEYSNGLGIYLCELCFMKEQERREEDNIIKEPDICYFIV